MFISQLFFRAVLSTLLVTWLVGCSHDEIPTPAADSTMATRDDHLALGNPSGATTDVNQPTNYLLLKPQYALSYHRDRGIPNWVSWHLSAAWLGTASRQDDFRADNTLPSGWYRVTASSYSGSGFDRGHNCPSGDRTSTVADNSATFLMTNMVPQAPQNNQQTWAKLEDYCRTLVAAGNELYVVCGSYGNGGTGTNGYQTTLDNGRVAVPNRIWKVIVVLPVGANDVGRVTSST
ncbi:DNA/RNA non-specific endonuclease [Hymenobacter nivis]|uniref:DNA/RNA non-specific endonuclease n=1 Tax=Hymenobacter nivis TaxID=1850093 RepID=UPI002682A76D